MVEIKPTRGSHEPFPRWSLLIALAAALAAFATVLSGQENPVLQRVEQFWTDLRTSMFSDRRVGDHPDVVLVSVGDNVSSTRATFGQRTDIDRERLARIITTIDDIGPRALGLDLPLGTSTDQAKEQALQRAVREARTRVIVGVRQDATTTDQRVWLERFIGSTGRASGHMALIAEGDRVVRNDSGPLAMSRTPESFAVLMARALRPEVRRNFNRISWLQKIDDNAWLSRWFNVGAQQPFRLVYGEELLGEGRALASRAIANKLVILTTGYSDLERYRTPLSLWSGEAVPNAVIQAQAIAQALDGRSVAEPQPRTIRILLFALALLGGIFGWYRGRGGYLIGIVVVLFALVVLDSVFYALQDMMLPTMQALLVWVLGYVTGRGLRRILGWEERYGRPWPLDADDTTARPTIGLPGNTTPPPPAPNPERAGA